MTKKILYLDFDGVLNTPLYRGSHNANSPVGHYDMLIDPDRVALVDRVARSSGADIVISSSWREVFPLKALERLLRSKGLRARVVGRTPTLAGWPRSREIAAWNENNRVGRFCILDDMASAGIGLEPWLVQTALFRGITPEDAERCLALLGQREKRAMLG